MYRISTICIVWHSGAAVVVISVVVIVVFIAVVVGVVLKSTRNTDVQTQQKLLFVCFILWFLLVKMECEKNNEVFRLSLGQFFFGSTLAVFDLLGFV